MSGSSIWGYRSEERTDGVFTVPTFVLDGEVVSLGTLSWERLMPLLEFEQDSFAQDQGDQGNGS